MTAPQIEFTNAFLDGDGSTVVGLWRNPAGALQRRSFPASWDSFHRKEDVPPERMTVLRQNKFVRGVRVEGGFVRVTWVTRDVRERAMYHEGSAFRQQAVQTFEADVDPVTRWLVDERVRIARPRRCYLDIESDSRVSFSERRKMRVLCWSLSGEDEVVFARGRLDEDTDEDEKRVLLEYWKAIAPYDQVVCWNGSYGGKAFDFDVVNLRSDARGIRYDERLWHWVDQLPVFEGMNMHSAESGAEKASMRLGDIAQEILGRGKETVPDFVRARFGDRCNRGLGALAWDLWEAGGEFRELLFKYNENDSVLLPGIEKKTKFLELHTALAQTCGIFPDMRVMKAGRRVDGFMLRLGAAEGVRFPSKPPSKYTVARFAAESGEAPEGADDEGEVDGREKQFKGAVVFDVMTLDRAWRKKHGMMDGIARDVHVFDFSGMYPSIILSWNMGTDTQAPVAVNGPIPDGFTRSPLTGVGFSLAHEAYLVKALRVLMKERARWTKVKADLPPGTPEAVAADRMSQAMKIVINAFYGDLGNPYSRFHNREVAESVTQNGVWLIKRVAEECEKRGWLVLYADTDGAYVKGPDRESAGKFSEWCNREVFPEMVRAVGCSECAIKLAYEKELRRVVWTSKKRYVGSYAHFKGTEATADSKPEVKGIEYKRGDTSRLARDLQTIAIDMLVGGMGVATCPVPTDDLSLYHGVLSEVRTRVLEGVLEAADVRIAKRLTQAPKDYKQKEKKGGGMTDKPPHVRVAEILKKRGRAVGVGMKIEYVVSDGSKSPAEIIPAEDYDGTNADRYHVWEKMVFPPTERLLSAAYPDHDWSSWAKVRPSKPRGRAAIAEAAGQLSLGDLPPADLSETRGMLPPAGGSKSAFQVWDGQMVGNPIRDVYKTVCAHYGVEPSDWDDVEPGYDPEEPREC